MCISGEGTRTRSDLKFFKVRSNDSCTFPGRVNYMRNHNQPLFPLLSVQFCHAQSIRKALVLSLTLEQINVGAKLSAK